MGTGTLTKYSASAGSGKTFHLAANYLTHLFRSKENYRKILAVTFTNKSTAEMKNRILDQLYILSTGGESLYLPDLIKTTRKSEEVIRADAGEILFSILHDFSRFSVCTIDAFFQKIIRAFARESGLHSGFNIELDHSMILASAVDEMIASSAENQELKNWLNEYVDTKIAEGKSWNPKGEIINLAEEIFKEKFKILSLDERTKLEDKKFLLAYIDKIKSVRSKFEEELSAFGKQCEDIFSEFGLTDEMFYQKGRGIPNFIRSLAQGNVIPPNNYVKAILDEPPKWSTKAIAPELKHAIENGFDKVLENAIRYYEENEVKYNSAGEILSNIYALGILSDILNKVRTITSAENIFLISDAGELLTLITGGDQAPFIYEKIGNRYENYLIDEFQDTSMLQWNNFLPLIEESLGRGKDNLVVGDVKQSIYRFRNSDWQILGKIIDRQFADDRLVSKPLKTNWRSRSNIIRFNNSLFSVIPDQIDKLFPEELLSISFKKLYSEAIQDDPVKSTSGYVRLDFIDDDYKENISGGNKSGKKISIKWEDKVLKMLPSVIERFQDKGYGASDIGILVRDGREGTAVLNRMIQYSNSCTPEQKKKYNYNIVSDYSLVLSNSPAVTFIIGVLKVLNDQEDMISRAEMLRFYLQATGAENSENVPLFSKMLKDNSHSLFPEGLEKFLSKSMQLPLFETVENIISFFGLGNYSWNVAYLNTFQDCVLNFTETKNADFQSFLDWWELTGNKNSVVLPANQDAAKVYTIHKSKGLEFKVVILPFLSWNDDHNTYHRPIIWVKPDTAPFNDLGIVPIRYKRNPPESIFTNVYLQEKYSAYLDNLNLLYVAMTRAKDAIYGFVPEHPDTNSGIAKIIKDALLSDENPAGKSGMILHHNYNDEEKMFEFGKIPEMPGQPAENKDLVSVNYTVTQQPESLKLKLHGENYFLTGKEAVKQKINYGKLMHEVFEGINASGDIPASVKKLVYEGKIPESESKPLETRLNTLISVPPVSEWFKPGNKVLKETEILLPSGVTKRPDRVILADGKTVIIDFKFGVENEHYAEQMRQYRNLLSEMGYHKIEAFLWYVDKNKIVKA